MRVLVVDSDRERRDSLVALLQADPAAHEASACGTPHEASALQALFRPALVLVEWHLPDPGIRSIIAWNQGLPTAERSHVLALTSSAKVSAIHAILDAGADDFAAWPLTPDDLKHRLDAASAALARRTTAQAATSTEPPLSRLLLSLTREIVIGVDLDRRIVVFNPAAERAFGCAESEMLGKHADLLYAVPSDGDELHHAAMSDGAVTREFVHCRKDGAHFTCRVTATPFRDRAGRLAGVIGIARDITGELEGERNLRESEARLRRLAEGTRAMPWEANLVEKRVTYAGPQALAFTGISAAESASPEAWMKVIHPEDREGVTSSLAAGIANYINFELEFRIINPAGATIWIRNIVSVERDAAGTPVNARGFAFDNSTLHHTQDHATRIQQALQNATDAILILDASGSPVFRNKTFINLFGEESADGVALGGLIPGITDAQTAASLGAAVRATQPWFGEAEVRLHDGRLGIFLVRASAIHDDTGTSLGNLCILTEITERKKFDESRLQASKLESIGLLAGGIAHDFNNLLLVISGNLFLARSETDASSVTHEFLTEAEKGATRAAELSQQLLTFARGGAPVRKNARLDAIVRETVELNLHGSRTVAELDLATNLWPAMIDRTQIAQAIANLVINAREAMNDRGVIRISARNETIARGHPSHLTPGDYVRVEVADNGPGIPHDVIARIFDPYFTTKPTGTGLGLATTHSIICKHDGAILVDSPPGGGATFTFLLPASKKPLKYESRRIDPIPRGTGRILIMDDEDGIRHAMRHALARLGYEATDAPNGVETLRLFREAHAAGTPFDIVILDLTIPGGRGGEEIIKDLLAEEPGLKAVACSGYADNPVIARFAEHGFKGALKKPFQVEDMARLIDHVMHNRPSTPL